MRAPSRSASQTPNNIQIERGNIAKGVTFPLERHDLHAGYSLHTQITPWQLCQCRLSIAESVQTPQNTSSRAGTFALTRRSSRVSLWSSTYRHSDTEAVLKLLAGSD